MIDKTTLGKAVAAVWTNDSLMSQLLSNPLAFLQALGIDTVTDVLFSNELSGFSLDSGILIIGQQPDDLFSTNLFSSDDKQNSPIPCCSS